ncbi:probable serine/threonine-protein kinase At1g54610 isoform X1 [Malania oleifera]|uniref:probable serine/threonine-protein kinase At1g54610 isoform X1 n=1 Tax=Malania oleifera TaxID=397392 RepID=UPI0025ADB94E|nr:probable serine/threonine-protein kinase At1g54610 isoform X1 [Malania oleifera]
MMILGDRRLLAVGGFCDCCAMGCICGKSSAAIANSRESPRERLSIKGSSKGQESFRLERILESCGSGVALIEEKANGSYRFCDNSVDEEKKTKKNREKSEDAAVAASFRRIVSIPKATEGEQVAAGWPSWLAAVAGEAISGWVPRRADSFQKLDKIGQGTYSNVYKAHDIIHKKNVALKRVRFDNLDPESVKFMAREILVLRRLDHPNVIKLEGLITSKMSRSLYLVFEYMEHDLAGLASCPGIKFTEPQVKCYMHQLLSGLEHCHTCGILHRDIKGSNLLVNNGGILKIADFGLASFFDPNHSVPMTSRVVTLWYRPPELLLGASEYGVAIDLWSTGCILGELYSGEPIMPGRTEVEQLHKIFKLCGSPSEDFWRKAKLPLSTVFKPQQTYRRCVAKAFKDFPAAAVKLLDTLLSIDPSQRGTAEFALKSEFFTTKPLACDPSSLPKYPPSKEFNVKLPDEGAERRGAKGGWGLRQLEKRSWRKSRAIPVPDANVESVVSMQKRNGHSHAKSRSKMLNPHAEDTASGFLIDPPRRSDVVIDVSKDLPERLHRKSSHSGPLVHGAGWKKVGKKFDDVPRVSSGSNGLVATSISCSDDQGEPSGAQLESTKQKGRLSCSLIEMDPARMQNRNCQMQTFVRSCQMEDGKSNARVPDVPSHESKGNKIYFSGPLFAPSNNVDQMLKDHDRRIQEIARRARLDKAKYGKVRAQGRKTTANSTLISSRGTG